MKTTSLLAMILLSAGLLPSCTESDASTTHSEDAPLENGAGFRKGEGVFLTDEMAHSIGLKTAEVIETKIDSIITVSIRATSVQDEVSGWLNSKQAESLKPGSIFELQDGSSSKATVTRIEKPAFANSSEYEIVLHSDTSISQGSVIKASIHLPSTEEVVAVPREAVLTTAEGLFVYAKNGKFFVRTPVKVGVSNATEFQILDGLYAGDEVVTSPVNSLWMAELQVLRGGKACTCGQ